MSNPDSFSGDCPHCGCSGPHPMFPRLDGIHHADVNCVDCGRHWFPPKPDSEKRKRPAQHRAMVEKFSRGFCELCTIQKTELPKGETLHAHHVDEFQDEGTATRENTWILCTACHSLVHWRRTYVGHLLRKLAASTEIVR